VRSRQSHGMPLGFFGQAEGDMPFTVEDFEDACKSASSIRKPATGLLSMFWHLWTDRLLPTEKELLGSFANHALIQFAESEPMMVICANGDQLDLDDSVEQSRYLEAALSLCRRGLLISSRDRTFMLSAKGRSLAKKLADRGWRALKFGQVT
jgi:hypothetical protein